MRAWRLPDVTPGLFRGDTIAVVNPATDKRIARVSVATAADVGAAVARAREAQAPWGRLPFSERAHAMRRFRDTLVTAKDRIAETAVAETGKPRTEALAAEVFYVCDAAGFWARRAARLLADERIRPHVLKNKVVYSTYVPMGVVGIIGPWNFPLALTLGEALPALMAGNAVVIKPSEVTPLSALLAAELWHEAGLPPDLLQVVTGRGETGAALVDAADMICFTGSVATGKKVMERAAQRLIPVSLELGGKDPMIVLRDANLERAANACVWGALMNCGQVCTSVERVYVEEPVYEQFIQLVSDRVRRLRQGTTGVVDLGSMTFAPQLEKVERHVADALAKGARLVVGGQRPARQRGLFYPPTVLADVSHDMEIMRDETFGPVIPIMKVRDTEEALRLANDSRYGLAASIFTRDRRRGRTLARRIQAGGVCINECLVHFGVLEAPMGGIKESGIGRRHGATGIRRFCHQQTVLIDRFGFKRELNWYPASRMQERLVRWAINLFGPLRRLAGRRGTR